MRAQGFSDRRNCAFPKRMRSKCCVMITGISGKQTAALREEIKHMRRMLFGSGCEKNEKGDWIVIVRVQPFSEGIKEEHRSEPASGKKAEVKAETKKYRRQPESCNVTSRRIEKVSAYALEEIYACPRFVSLGAAEKEKKHIHVKILGTIQPDPRMGAIMVAMDIRGKYALHLPLHLQIKEFECLEIDRLSDRILRSRMRVAAEAMEPLRMAMHGLLLKSRALREDETLGRSLKASLTKGTRRLL